ncbi:MAG: peptidase domain-containing ABC transporter [Solirubrobacterales bacterium]|nr:peptidase domain-containing ABC transporter [Solirubrobacterales bacterium]
MPCVRQMEGADCGAACLAMVLAYFGKGVALDELREMTGTGRGGVTARSLVQAARAYGLGARGVQADVDRLRDLPRASVLHWEFEHFVVLERVTRRGIRVVDPAHGRRIVPFDVVRRAYTGVAMTFDPTDAFDPAGATAKGTWRYLRPMLAQPGTLARVLITSALLRLLTLVLPLLTLVVVDELVPRDDRQLLPVFAIGVTAVIGYQFLSSFLRAHLLLTLRMRLDMRLTMGFVDHLVELPYAFFLRRSSGDLMMRLHSNTTVREILSTSAMAAVVDGTFATISLVLVFIVSASLGSLVLGVAVVQVAVMVLSWRRNQRLTAESLQSEAKTQSYAYELLAGIETLKAAGAQQRAAEHWGGLFIDQLNVALKRGRLSASVESANTTLQFAAPLLILLAGAYLVVNGQLSLGAMFAVAALASSFLQPLGAFVQTGILLQQLGSYMERINDVLDTPREQAPGAGRPAGRLRGHLRADRVSYQYGPLSPMVVSDVSLDVTPGQHIGIVGRSGSGKSTLAHLLLGLYSPTSGQIEFDGINLADLDSGSVRRQLGIVTQHPYLFASSIRENIALTDPQLPLEPVIAAAKLACIHDDIAAMPMGYETTLADGGSSLSGGQRQRIALARALVHRPSILLLDEATSDLDTVTEQSVYENLAPLSCTTIVIAHRLSTIRNADLIVVLEQGKIAESGTHEQLIASAGVYRELVNAQASLADETHSTSGIDGTSATNRTSPPIPTPIFIGQRMHSTGPLSERRSSVATGTTEADPS